MLDNKIDSIKSDIRDAESRSEVAHSLLEKQQNRKDEIEEKIAEFTDKSKNQVKTMVLHAKQQDDMEIAKYAALTIKSIERLHRDCTEEFLKFNIDLAMGALTDFLHDKLDDPEYQFSNVDINILKNIVS